MEAATDLERRVQRLEDIRALEDLLMRYSVCADLHLVDEYVDLYTPDGVIDLTDYGLPRYEGREQLREFIQGPQAAGKAGISLHIAGPTTFFFDGDVAHGEGYAIVCTRRLSGARVRDVKPAEALDIYISHANYSGWTFLRTNGSWKIRSRVVKLLASTAAPEIFSRTLSEAR